jgi:hypothetical protein
VHQLLPCGAGIRVVGMSKRWEVRVGSREQVSAHLSRGCCSPPPEAWGAPGETRAPGSVGRRGTVRIVAEHARPPPCPPTHAGQAAVKVRQAHVGHGHRGAEQLRRREGSQGWTAGRAG